MLSSSKLFAMTINRRAMTYKKKTSPSVISVDTLNQNQHNIALNFYIKPTNHETIVSLSRKTGPRSKNIKMATHTIGSSGKYLTCALNSFRKSSSTQDRMFRGLPNITSYPPQIEATSRCKVVHYRSVCQSVHSPPRDRMKSFKPFNFGWACITPVTKITSPTISTHLWGGTKLFATKTTPSTPKGGSIKVSGGRVGRLDAAHEDGFFHKLNISKLEQMKEMIRKKNAEKKKEEGKPDSFSSYNERAGKLDLRSGFV